MSPIFIFIFFILLHLITNTNSNYEGNISTDLEYTGRKVFKIKVFFEKDNFAIPFYTDLESSINYCLDPQKYQNYQSKSINWDITNKNANIPLLQNKILSGKEHRGDILINNDKNFQIKNIPIIITQSTKHFIKTNKLIDKLSSFAFAHKVDPNHSIVHILAKNNIIKKKKFSFMFKDRTYEIGKIFFDEINYKENFHFSTSFHVPKNALYWEIPISYIFIGEFTYEKTNTYFENIFPARFSTSDPLLKVPNKLLQIISKHTYRPFLKTKRCNIREKTIVTCHQEVFSKFPDITFVINEQAMRIPMRLLYIDDDYLLYRFLITKGEEDAIIMGTSILSMFISEFDYDNDKVLLLSKEINFYPVDSESLFPMRRNVKYILLFISVVIIECFILFFNSNCICNCNKKKERRKSKSNKRENLNLTR